MVVVEPLPGVRLCVQSGKGALLPPVAVNDEEMRFDVRIRFVAAGGVVTARGPAVQGPPKARFVYINAGSSAGQPGSCWVRRAKVSLMAIDHAMLAELAAVPGAALEARVHGRARDGGPLCASVPLLDGGWRVVAPPT